MAATKIWPIKDNLKRVVNYAENPDKTELADLKQALHYAENGEKTSVGDEKSCFVTGVNCRAETAFEEMTTVKNHFGKVGGNIAYHAYQSFKPNEVTPEQCHEIGVALAKKLWGKSYQVLVATHLDRGHLHNHFVLNSVSFVNGKKFNCDKRAYYDMRNASDELCKQQDLSVIKNPKGKTPRSIYFAEKNGEPTKHNLMREAIDAAISVSNTLRQFHDVMKKQGYVIEQNPNRKYPTIRSVNNKKAVRMYQLGEDYLPEAITQRIANKPLHYGDYQNYLSQSQRPQPRKVNFKGNLASAKKITGLRALYFHYCYLLGIFPKNKPRHKPLSPEMREALRKIDRYSRQVRLVCKHKLDTTDDVKTFIEQTETKMSEVTTQRNGIYNKLRRCTDPKRIAELKAQRDVCTVQLSALRKDKKVAGTILADVDNIKDKIRIERDMQVTDRTPQRAEKKRGYER